MANVDIVYEWTAGEPHGDVLYGTDIDGNGYVYLGGEWKASTVLSNPAITPALAALARIAETIGSVTWRADNTLD